MKSENSFQITIVSDADTWLNPYLVDLQRSWAQQGHTVSWVHTPQEIIAGDFAFYLSCSKIVPKSIRQRNAHNLVVHESALPQGRGWSPLTWQILEGKNEIPITLLEAEDEVDSGDIYLQDVMCFTGMELVEELRALQASKTIELCLAFVAGYPDIIKNRRVQQGIPSYYPRRRPKDSELDVDKTIREQFNLLRVVDSNRYPAFFRLNNSVYLLRIEQNTEMEESV